MNDIGNGIFYVVPFMSNTPFTSVKYDSANTRPAIFYPIDGLPAVSVRRAIAQKTQSRRLSLSLRIKTWITETQLVASLLLEKQVNISIYTIIAVRQSIMV